MNFSGLYGHIHHIDEHDCAVLQPYGLVFGRHDRAGDRYPVFVPQHAAANLHNLPELLDNPGRSGPGIWCELYPRQRETLLENVDLNKQTLETLRGEVALARFAADTEPGTFAPEGAAPDHWSKRAQSSHAALWFRLQAVSPLVRVISEGEIELSTGAYGVPGDAPGTITVRVFLDREDGDPDARPMVIETAIPPEDLRKQLGDRVASEHAHALTQPNARVVLLGRSVPLDGQLAERIGRGDWSPAHAHRVPPLRLWSIDDAIGWAKNHLPHFNFADHHGLPKQALLSLYQTQGRTDPSRRPSLQDVLDAARALEGAKLMLERSLDLGQHWVAHRIGHVLDAEARYGLAPPARLADQFRTKDQQYVITIDGPGSNNPRHPQPTVYWTGRNWTTDLALASRYTSREAATVLESALSAYPHAGTARYDALAKQAERTESLTM
ncbi:MULTISPECIES: hypothetical protein [Cupriavidus]